MHFVFCFIERDFFWGGFHIFLAWKRIMSRKIKFLMRLTRKMRQFKDV